jgi:serine protease
VRVLGKCGGYDSDIAAGMRWAAERARLPWLTVRRRDPARVINLSLGGDGACAGSAYPGRGRPRSRPRAPSWWWPPATAPAVRPARRPTAPGVVAVAGLRHAGTKVGFSDIGPR